jgi:hypothetical protein
VLLHLFSSLTLQSYKEVVNWLLIEAENNEKSLTAVAQWNAQNYGEAVIFLNNMQASPLGQHEGVRAGFARCYANLIKKLAAIVSGLQTEVCWLWLGEDTPIHVGTGSSRIQCAGIRASRSYSNNLRQPLQCF